MVLSKRYVHRGESQSTSGTHTCHSRPSIASNKGAGEDKEHDCRAPSILCCDGYRGRRDTGLRFRDRVAHIRCVRYQQQKDRCVHMRDAHRKAVHNRQPGHIEGVVLVLTPIEPAQDVEGKRWGMQGQSVRYFPFRPEWLTMWSSSGDLLRFLRRTAHVLPVRELR